MLPDVAQRPSGGFRKPYLRLSAFICGWIVLLLSIRGLNLGACEPTNGSYAERRG